MMVPPFLLHHICFCSFIIQNAPYILYRASFQKSVFFIDFSQIFVFFLEKVMFFY